MTANQVIQNIETQMSNIASARAELTGGAIQASIDGSRVICSGIALDEVLDTLECIATIISDYKIADGKAQNE